MISLSRDLQASKARNDSLIIDPRALFVGKGYVGSFPGESRNEAVTFEAVENDLRFVHFYVLTVSLLKSFFSCSVTFRAPMTKACEDEALAKSSAKQTRLAATVCESV